MSGNGYDYMHQLQLSLGHRVATPNNPRERKSNTRRLRTQTIAIAARRLHLGAAPRFPVAIFEPFAVVPPAHRILELQVLSVLSLYKR